MKNKWEYGRRVYKVLGKAIDAFEEISMPLTGEDNALDASMDAIFNELQKKRREVRIAIGNKEGA